MANPRTFIAGTSSAVAPVAALPTTAAHLAIQNLSPGKIYTITSIGLTTTTSAAATQILQPIAHNAAGPSTTLITGTAALGPKALDGIQVPSQAIVFSAVTIVQTNIWHPVGTAVNSAALTATIGLGTWTYVRGLYYVPYGGIFSLAAFCDAAGSAACNLFVTWEEA